MFSDQNDPLAWAHPIVREWFINKFGSPTQAQEQGWPAILAGKSTLISAPTGSGKTFAAFLICIERLIGKSLYEELTDQTEVLYVSPLKALSYDIHKNLTEPLAEISQRVKQAGWHMADIRAAVRTGDTPAYERQTMLKKPPHILVTTPESLYILLTAEKSREILRTVKTVIIDEIHALAPDKRGAHLSLSLERLQAITISPPIRIGLSATQKPIELIANFLVGNNRPSPVIINMGHSRQLELTLEVPSSELGAIATHKIWDETYDRLAELAKQNRSTLIFVNTRKLAERVAHHLAQRLGEEVVAAHHGSLSRKLRLNVEGKLKRGELKALVATASLELGIDVGTIDLVCQIGSPRSIAITLQRIGRAGHWRGAIPKGCIFATTRDELVECAALIKAIRARDLDQIIIPQQPIDILAQQIIATCATQEWHEDELFALIKKSFSYAELTRESFDSVVEMLAEGIAGSRGRYSAYLFRDQVNGIVKARRGARLTAITNGGAIPENGLFSVILEADGVMVGTLDEDFAIESNRGDIILLGTHSWRIQRVESVTGRVIVEDAHGAPPTVPFWRGEAPGRTKELSAYVADLRQKISNDLPINTPAIAEVRKQAEITAILNWLKKSCKLNDSAAEQLLEYIRQGQLILGAVPTQTTIIAERFFDEGGGMQLIIHSPFGARINKAWGLALRKCFCRSFNFELQAGATDDGINISLTEQHSFPLADVFKFLHVNSIREILIQAILQSPLFATRWRWDATRALALLRFRNGKKIPPNILRMRADDLLAAVFPDAAACQDNLGGRDIELPNHPLIQETMKDCLTEALDIDGLISLLTAIQQGEIKCIAVDTPMPSVFSHAILNANPYAFLDDAPLEERRARAVEMRRTLPQTALEEIGRLDPEAILEVQQQAWPDIRDADELHDFLQTLIAFPLDHVSAFDSELSSLSWKGFFALLAATGRAGLATTNGKYFWVATEKTKSFSNIYPHTIFHDQLKAVLQKKYSREEALVNLIRGWMLHIGPTTQQELTKLLNLEAFDVEQALLKLESTGFILRGHFKFNQADTIEWCERRLLARIHRLTLEKLRKEIQPIKAAEFVNWLVRWQHVAPQTQLKGEHGLLEVIKQLQGFEIAANAWESQIFSKRIADYSPDMLDQLCLKGVIGWARLSLHPAMITASDKNRINPTSIVPITFFLREESNCITSFNSLTTENLAKLSPVAKNIYAFLSQKGASFLVDIVRVTGNLKSEVEMGLWELVAAGLITADSFDNLRALIDPHRRLGRKGRYRIKSYFGSGRWSLLTIEEKLDHDRYLEEMCEILLKRYGVIFRDLLTREKNIPAWRELLPVLRRLEDRGEIRGGRFVGGFRGEQFALPYAVTSLRATKRKAHAGKSEPITLSAVDPLNLIGIILPGSRIPAISGNKVNLSNEVS